MKNMHSSMRTPDPSIKTNLRGAVEGGDSIAIVLGVLQKLKEVVSGDNSGGDVASSYHGCSWNEVNRTIIRGRSIYEIFSAADAMADGAFATS